MPRYKDEPPAVHVYTVCDESRYLIVRNVPALGCGDELLKLFATYGDVEGRKPMDAEDCERYTDVYWVKFRLVSNARFAKRKLDEFVFLGNRLQVSYSLQFESVSDTKEKLETRRKEVLARVNSSVAMKQDCPSKSSSNASQETILGSEWNSSQPEFIQASESFDSTGLFCITGDETDSLFGQREAEQESPSGLKKNLTVERTDSSKKVLSAQALLQLP